MKLIIVLFLPASRIRYEITSGNIGGAFAVKNMTGAIYVAGALDYETRKRVSFRTIITSIPYCFTFFHCDATSKPDRTSTNAVSKRVDFVISKRN